MIQSSIYDTHELTEKAIQAAGAFADPLWGEEARAAVKLVALQGEEFTTDQVHELLNRRGLTTLEPRALGSIIREAVKDGLIMGTGRYRKSTRPECHRRPLAIWVPRRRNFREYGDSE